MAHLIDSMAYTGQPWHGLGNILPPQQSITPTTIARYLAAGSRDGLGYSPYKERVRSPTNWGKRPHPQ